MILRDWYSFERIKIFFIERKFIEILYKSEDPLLNSLKSVFFRTGKHNYSEILGIVELNGSNPTPSKIIELYLRDRKTHLSKVKNFDLTIDYISYLIIIPFKKNEIHFADLSQRRSNHIIKGITDKDLVFNWKLHNLEFNTSKLPSSSSFIRLFENRDDAKIREIILKELIEKNNKISIEDLRKSLNFNNTTKLHLQILRWSKIYQFVIDGAYLLFDKKDLNLFIKDLENSYKDWFE